MWEDVRDILLIILGFIILGNILLIPFWVHYFGWCSAHPYL